MAGISGEIALEDAIDIAKFQVAMGRIPPAGEWVEELAERLQHEKPVQAIESIF